MNTTIRSALFVLVAGAVGFACVTTRPITDQDRLPDFIGQWESKEFMTQLGAARQYLCIEANGTFRLLLNAQGADMDVGGKYKMAASSIILETDDRKTFALRLTERHILVDDAHEPGFEFHRSSRPCASGRMSPKAQ
jgi:hypothetical protein